MEALAGEDWQRRILSSLRDFDMFPLHAIAPTSSSSPSTVVQMTKLSVRVGSEKGKMEMFKILGLGPLRESIKVG